MLTEPDPMMLKIIIPPDAQLFVRMGVREEDRNVSWSVGIVRRKVGPVEPIWLMQRDE
jgi:hypothetical protein